MARRPNRWIGKGRFFRCGDRDPPLRQSDPILGISGISTASAPETLVKA